MTLKEREPLHAHMPGDADICLDMPRAGSSRRPYGRDCCTATNKVNNTRKPRAADGECICTYLIPAQTCPNPSPGGPGDGWGPVGPPGELDLGDCISIKIKDMARINHSQYHFKRSLDFKLLCTVFPMKNLIVRQLGKPCRNFGTRSAAPGTRSVGLV